MKKALLLFSSAATAIVLAGVVLAHGNSIGQQSISSGKTISIPPSPLVVTAQPISIPPSPLVVTAQPISIPPSPLVVTAQPISIPPSPLSTTASF